MERQMSVITTSVFELLKIGPGPSSSHTIGPMNAGHDFYLMMRNLPQEQQAAAVSLQVLLYGSLAATGRGHGTDRAIVAGLLGKTPEDCPPDFLDSISLEHHLGMTCDPVKGYVQIPCIERNAMGAVKAYTAYLIAREGLPQWHIVGLDKAVEAMRQTGRDMKAEYRETSQGGLARCC